MRNYVDKLAKGEVVSFRPKGNSMNPRIKSGQKIFVSPVGLGDELKVDDIVFCRVKGNYYVHLIKAIKDDRYLIGNNHGKENGWIGKSQVYGKVIRVE